MTNRILFLALASITAVANAADFLETEANDTKATANAFTLAAGDRIIGNSTSASGVGLDYFKVKTTPAAPGIYQHRLIITTAGTAGHTGTIRGLTVSGGVAGGASGTASLTSDTALQTSSTTTTPARFNQWYGFGKEEELYYRVTGGTTTTSDYEATLETTQVTPADLGTFAPGSFNITTFDLSKSPTTTGFTFTDTEMTLYDGNFVTQPSWNSDDYFPLQTGHTLSSRVIATLAPGTYYLAISQFNLTTGLPADASFENGPNDSITDFLDLALCTSSTVTHGTPAVPVSLDFSITTGAGTTVFDAAKPGAFGVYWAKFTVAAPAEVSGTVTLQDFGGTVAGRSISVEFVGGSTVSATLDASGNWSVPAPAAGTYDVRIKASHWLSKLVSGVAVTGSGATGVNASLINGDVDGDNEVGPGDFGGLALAFLSVDGDPNWNSEADLDGDGEVGPGDFGILANNFLLSGE